MGLFDSCRCCPSVCFRPKPENLTLLDLSHNCLEDVPNNVFSHERTLEQLFIESNQIRDLPRALFHCEGLRRLNLSDNELQSIPSAIQSLVKLEELNISKNHILQIPDAIKSCKCLKVVDASINPLGPRLPDGFTQLINLEELYLNDAFLEFLPANFGRLSRLQIVELRENHLKLLPKSMARLIELRRLDIGQNDFLELPEVIGSLHKLSELWCDCNRIISIPNIIGNLKELTYLDASYNRIEEIGSDIGQCLALTDLTLTSNNLIELPESIGNLVNLNILRIDENEIKSISPSIGSLPSLEELVFNNNDIETLPSNIGLLRNLQTLIGDCNRISELPASIGSCMSLRILSLAENRLKVIPDEIGRLSSLKVLNLNSNFLTYLPLSLTKISGLQALWLSENQTKPLIQFQSDIDKESGQKVLTCFLLPQIPSETHRNSIKSLVSPNNSNNTKQALNDKQFIKFSNDSSNFDLIDDEIEDRTTTKLIRAPTPYPKELKAHARHARNLALKQKDANITSDPLNSNTQMVVAVNDMEQKVSENDQNSSHFEVKEAKVLKPQKSPTNSRNCVNNEMAKRPTTLPVSSSFNVKSFQNNQKSALNSNSLELVASKISQILREEDDDSVDDSGFKPTHERKGSYKVAVNSSLSSMKSPIERKIKSKSVLLKEDLERGYKSDVEYYSNEKLSNNSITGYSSDCELSSKRFDRFRKVLTKECESDSALIQKSYESNLINRSDSESVYKSFEMENTVKEVPNGNSDMTQTSRVSDSLLMQNPTEKRFSNPINVQNSSKNIKMISDSDLVNNKSIVKNSKAINSNSSIGSLYTSSGSERPVSVCSGRSPFSSTGSTASPNTSANTSQCSLSRNETTIIETKSQIPALPPKPMNYSGWRTPDSGMPVVTNPRLRHPQTASSQFIFHKFSHDSYTKPLIGHNSSSHTVVTTDEIHSKWNVNGIHFIDDSNESNGSTNSLNKSNNESIRNTNRILTNDCIHAFPVIIVKNPGLGFSIECLKSKKPNDSSGIFVSSVEPAGSASTALKVGDRILQIDGIDLQNATKDMANHIFQTTGKTISLMVSREKF